MKQTIFWLITMGIIVIALAAGVFLYDSQNPGSSPLLGYNSSSGSSSIPAVADVNSTQVTAISPEFSHDQATALVNEEYDSYQYSIASINLTSRYSGKLLYQIDLTRAPGSGSSFSQNKTVFIDAITGDYYTPAQETAKISIDQAKSQARNAFPGLLSDRIKMIYLDGTQYERSWSFTFLQNNETLIQGGLDPDTGELMWYSVPVMRNGRPEKLMVQQDAAQITAEQEIRNRNGVLPLIMTEARYDPLGMPDEKVAGQYVFVYRRLIREVPCDSDGLVITVDSVSGNVTRYSKQWNLPENAVAGSPVPKISNATAIATVLMNAKESYPSDAGSIRLISADLRWKDLHNPKITPTLGSIPLAWKVQFDDAVIRAKQWPVPAYGWIDAQNGTLLEMYYRH
jgi:hypothetical protein